MIGELKINILNILHQLIYYTFTCLFCMDLLVHMFYATDYLHVYTNAITFNTMKDS